MTKKRNLGAEILEGLRELKARRTGRVWTHPSVSAIRERIGLSQSQFAKLMGVSVRTLQDWEQGRRAPSGPARTLLIVAQRNPRALLEATTWDRQIESDSAAGRLDDLADESLNEHKAGKSRAL